MTGEISEIDLDAGILGLCPIPGRTGAYDADFRALLAFGPDLVLSLTPSPEMQRFAPDLVTDLTLYEIAWRQLPIPDLDILSTENEVLWLDISKEIHAVLDRGGKILVHCQAGCGRSGMIALRLMVERGEDPKAAFARLRRVRPCVIETEAQYLWASKQR